MMAKPTVDDYINYLEAIWGIPLLESQKLLIKKCVEKYEYDGRLFLTYPPRIGHPKVDLRCLCAVLEALKGETK